MRELRAIFFRSRTNFRPNQSKMGKPGSGSAGPCSIL
jgi:hypothetical protein